MRNRRFLRLLILCLILLWPKTGYGQSPIEDPVSYIGLNLNELYAKLGPPESVYAARGLEDWQDDVVFVYKEGDFYILKDRVWQLGLKSALGIGAGDNAASVSLILGSNNLARPALTSGPASGTAIKSGPVGTGSPGSGETRESGSSLYYFIDGKSWPLMLRCDFNKAGRVSVIFIYRSDL